MSFYLEDQMAIICINKSDLEECNAVENMTEGFIDFPMSIRGIEVAISLLEVGDKKYKIEAEFLQRLFDHLNDLKPARTLSMSDEEREYLNTLFLITAKPVIYTANIIIYILIFILYVHS